LEFLILGAKAVQIGTVNFINPHATIDVIEGIKNYLSGNKIKDINEIIDTFQP
jgi:dihydroorotate dehydrogenase (NAD+) catalytic subunit